MPSTSAPSVLFVFALAALTALVLQLPTRLSELVQVAGDVLFLPSLLAVSCMALIPFWGRPPPALLTVAGHLLSWTVRISVVVIDFGACSVGLVLEIVDAILRDEECRSRLELAAKRLQPAKVASTRWTEPPLLVKMFYATDMKTVFLSGKVKQLHTAVRLNQDRIRKLTAILKEEQQALDELIPRILRHKDKLRNEELEAERQLRAMERYKRLRIERHGSKPIWVEELYKKDWYRGRGPLPDPIPLFRQEMVVQAPPSTASCRVQETGRGLDVVEVDAVMPDAPELIEADEDPDVSMHDVEASDLANDIDMVDAPDDSPLPLVPVPTTSTDAVMDVRSCDDIDMSDSVAVRSSQREEAVPIQAPAPVEEVPVQAPANAALPMAISFDFQQIEINESRRIAKPRSRLRQRQTRVPAAASATAPAPAQPQPVPPPVPAAPVVVAAQPKPSVDDKDKDTAATASADVGKPTDLTQTLGSVMLPGGVIRRLLEDWIEACATFMETSDLCANVSPRWIRSWKQSTFADLGEKLPADVEKAHMARENVAMLAKRFFQYNLLRRMDGPVKDGKNGILRHVKELAAREGIDLGEVDI
ncbi:hypothetical protein VTH06DRAFT_2837 [Thermothelomyces fergusii]